MDGHGEIRATATGRLAGKTAIVTGAGGGFGEGIARLFAAEGARVAILDIRQDAAERVAADLGDEVIAIAADVGSRADVERAVGEVSKRFGTPDIVINNAGWTHRNQPMLDVDEAKSPAEAGPPADLPLVFRDGEGDVNAAFVEEVVTLTEREDAEGLRFWIFRDGLYEGEVFDADGKPAPPNWYVHGLFA